MVTAKRHKQPPDLALGRSSIAIPVIKVITAIHYLGPHSPGYSLAGLCKRGVNTCVGFKCPALLPLQGWDKSRDGGWLELVLLPEPGKDEPQPCKTLNCHISPWPGSPHSMKQPHATAERLLSQGGDPMVSTASRGARPHQSYPHKPGTPSICRGGAAWQPGQCFQWVCSRVK